MGTPGRAWVTVGAGNPSFPAPQLRCVSWMDASECFRLLLASGTSAMVPRTCPLLFLAHPTVLQFLASLLRESFGPCRKASLLGLRTYPCWVSGHPPHRVCAHPDSAFRIPALLSSLCPLIWCLSMLSPALTFHAGFSRLLPAFFSFL